MSHLPHRPLTLLSLLLLPVAPVLAQKPPKLPPTLLGRWQVRQVGFQAPPGMSDAARRYINTTRVRNMNLAILRGEARLLVEFRPDSTYTFTIRHSGDSLRAETGTFSLRRGHLLARSPGSADGSSFDNQWLEQLNRHTMMLVFPIAPQELPGVYQLTTYYRVGRVPTPAAPR